MLLLSFILFCNPPVTFAKESSLSLVNSKPENMSLHKMDGFPLSKPVVFNARGKTREAIMLHSVLLSGMLSAI
jgi:hypothetical protein